MWKWLLLVWLIASVVFWVQVWPRVWERPKERLTLVEVGEGEPRGEVLTESAIYFVPIEGFPSDLLDTLRDHYRDQWDLDVRILSTMTVEETAQLPSGQLDAYDLAFQLQRAYEAEVAPVAVIGFTTHGLGQDGLNFVYGANIAGGYAAISTAQMDPTPGDPPDEVVLKERLRKFTTRYIAFTYFDLPQSGNPSSVLSQLSGTHDLDEQGEFPCPSAPFVMASC